LCDRSGIPVSWATDGANRHDQVLLEPTLAAAPQGLIETLHLDRGHDGNPVLKTCANYGISDVVRSNRRPRGRTGTRRKPKHCRWG